MKRERSGSYPSNTNLSGGHHAQQALQGQFRSRPRSSSLAQPPSGAPQAANPRKVRVKGAPTPPVLHRSLSVDVNGGREHHHDQRADSRFELDHSLQQRHTRGHGSLHWSQARGLSRHSSDPPHGLQNQHGQSNQLTHDSGAENYNHGNSRRKRQEEPFHIAEDTFVSKNLVVTPNNVMLTSSQHRFREVQHEELLPVPRCAVRPLGGPGGDFNPSINPQSPYILGRGCSASVLLHVHRGTGVLVAVKRINVFNPDKRGQLLREIKALYSASCASMVRFYGAYYREGTISIMLEYLDRGTLKDVRAGSPPGPIPEKALAGVSYQLVWAFAYLKHANRIHRDVKPTNILVNHKGRVKLSDFGLSREILNSINECDSYVGSFKYMSPERLQNAVYSFSSDIWACGLVLYELATGQYPYHHKGTHCLQVMDAILNDPPPLLPSCYSQSARHVIGAMLLGKPESRPTASAVLSAAWFNQHDIHDIKTAAEACKDWVNASSQVPVVDMDILGQLLRSPGC